MIISREVKHHPQFTFNVGDRGHIFTETIETILLLPHKRILIIKTNTSLPGYTNVLISRYDLEKMKWANETELQNILNDESVTEEKLELPNLYAHNSYNQRYIIEIIKSLYDYLPDSSRVALARITLV